MIKEKINVVGIDNINDHWVILNTQSKNSKPIEMLIEKVYKTVCINLGSKAQISEKLDLEKSIRKAILNKKHSFNFCWRT